VAYTIIKSGFTLLEVLIAISISALIGIGATQTLYSVIQVKQKTEIKMKQLRELQRFDNVFSRDIEQYVNRSINDGYGSQEPGLQIGGSEYLIAWTRLGWKNSLSVSVKRSELQRVAYQVFNLSDKYCDSARKRLENKNIEITSQQCLVRFYWTVLDRAPDSEPKYQVLVDQVNAIDIEVSASINTYPDKEYNWYLEWPALQHTPAPVAEIIKLVIEIDGYEEIERIWGLPYAP
jgi:general secretion pathway protein J